MSKETKLYRDLHSIFLNQFITDIEFFQWIYVGGRSDFLIDTIQYNFSLYKFTLAGLINRHLGLKSKLMKASFSAITWTRLPIFQLDEIFAVLR